MVYFRPKSAFFMVVRVTLALIMVVSLSGSAVVLCISDEQISMESLAASRCGALPSEPSISLECLEETTDWVRAGTDCGECVDVPIELRAITDAGQGKRNDFVARGLHKAFVLAATPRGASAQTCAPMGLQQASATSHHPQGTTVLLI